MFWSTCFLRQNRILLTNGCCICSTFLITHAEYFILYALHLMNESRSYVANLAETQKILKSLIECASTLNHNLFGRYKLGPFGQYYCFVIKVSVAQIFFTVQIFTPSEMVFRFLVEATSVWLNPLPIYKSKEKQFTLFTKVSFFSNIASTDFCDRLLFKPSW